MKDGELIAAFIHNNKNFKLIYKDHKIKCLCYDENGNSYFKLSDEEKNVLIDVVKSLRVDEMTSHYVRDEYVNGRLYKIYYDSKSRNYFWRTDTNVDISNDNIYLNKKYNHIPSVVYFWHRPRTYEEKLDKQLRKYFEKWAIEDLDNICNYEERIHCKEVHIRNAKRDKFKRLLVNSCINLLLLSSLPVMNHIFVTSMEGMLGEDWKNRFSDISIVETVAPDYTTPDYSEEATETTKYVIEITEPTDAIEEKDEYSWELIRGAIERNPNLTDTEKNFLYELQFVFDENHQYMDLDMVVSRLETLKITYDSGRCPDDFDIGGRYWSTTNLIENFNANSFGDVDIAVFLHELFHVLQCPSNFKLTTELSNELFTREVLRRLHESGVLDKFWIKMNLKSPGYYEYGVGYEAWMNMYYDLAEILSQDALCEYQFQCNDMILVNGLCTNSTSIEYDRQVAWSLLDMINDSEYQLDPLTRSVPTNTKDVIDEYADYFYRMNGTSMLQNANCFANDLSFVTRFSNPGARFLLENLGKSQYIEYDDCMMFYTGTQPKTYFSDAFPDTIIYLELTGRGQNNERGIQMLEANGDLNVTYTINVDDEFEDEYSSYIATTNSQHIGR